MFNMDDYTNLKFTAILLGVLILLFIIKKVIIKKINLQDLEVTKRINVGNEEIQEDCMESVSTLSGTLTVLADGLGKNETGKMSSIIAVKTIIKLFENEGIKEKQKYFFNKSFNKANHEILKRVERDKGGASVLAVAINKNLLTYGLVGDLMLAIFRNKELVRLSEGHNISQVAKKQYYNGKIKKEEALYALKENKTLYYVGQDTFDNIEISEMPIKLNKNDIILLMSKGIYEGIRWIELENILDNKNISIDEMCEEIMEIINHNKNQSNRSIVLIKYCGTE